MSVFHNNALIGASGQGAAAGAGYEIERSLRFNSADSAYLNRTPSSAGNRRTFTFAFWIKKVTTSTQKRIFNCGPYTSGTGYRSFNITANGGTPDPFYIWDYSSNYKINLVATSAFRDDSAWYHLICAVDTTQATASDRVKLWINGIQYTDWDSAGAGVVYPAQNYETAVGVAEEMRIGARENKASQFLDGYLADFHYVDGQALDPTDFGEFDANNVWQPIAYSGSYGTNGFHLKFDNTADLGEDAAGSNDWTANNFSTTAGTGNDSLFDSPTNGTQTDTGAGGEVSGNYATWNPLDSSGNAITLSNGNLDVVNSTTTYDNLKATIAIQTGSGSWYWEAENTAAGSMTIGLVKLTANLVGNKFVGSVTGSWGLGESGYKWAEGSFTTGSAGYATVGDKVGVLFNSTAGTVTYYINGSPESTAFTGLTDGPYLPAVYARSSAGATFNFGQRAFAYSAPSGAKPLCTALLDDPTIADGSTAMDVVTYSGNSSNQTISGLNISPDLVWIKCRSTAYNHAWNDTVRGALELLSSSMTDAEYTDTTGVDSFTSDGWTFNGTGFYNVNGAGDTYVGWAWDAGSSTVANTDGSISSSVRANASAGFSIVSWTTVGSTGDYISVGHGLNVLPGLVITKSRSNADGWYTAHGFDLTQFGTLNTTNAFSGAGNAWGAGITSSVIGMRVGNFTANNYTHVAYCWAPVEGYSAFGSYTGNGLSDGVFVYTGMRPRWIMIKRIDTGGYSWQIHDTERIAYNVNTKALFANGPDSEYTFSSAVFDLLSNGFKARGGDNYTNASGGTYIYAAFAETPQKFARAR